MSEVQQFYQAIGELQATLVVALDGAKFLQSGLEQYPVFISPGVKRNTRTSIRGSRSIGGCTQKLQNKDWLSMPLP